jgi:hypothetical protein
LYRSLQDNEEGKPHLRGFQLSNQAAQLINENVIKVGRKKANTFIVSRSNERCEMITSSTNLRYVYPEIEYFETTGEEGARTTSLKKAGRYLDSDVLPYFIVTCPATNPINPKPRFKSFSFPATYSKHTEHGTEADASEKLQGLYRRSLWLTILAAKKEFSSSGSEDAYFDALNDFHFLLWLWRYLRGQEVLFDDLLACISGKHEKAGEVRSALEAFFGSSGPSSSPPKGTPADENSEAIKTIMEITGCSTHLAQEALHVSNGNLENAVNYALSAK